MVRGRNGHGPIWLGVEMTRNHFIVLNLYVLSKEKIKKKRELFLSPSIRYICALGKGNKKEREQSLVS